MCKGLQAERTSHVQGQEGGQCVQSRLRMEKYGGQRLGHGEPRSRSGVYGKDTCKDFNQESKNDLIHVLRRSILPWCLGRTGAKQDWRPGDALGKAWGGPDARGGVWTNSSDSDQWLVLCHFTDSTTNVPNPGDKWGPISSPHTSCQAL